MTESLSTQGVLLGCITLHTVKPTPCEQFYNTVGLFTAIRPPATSWYTVPLTGPHQGNDHRVLGIVYRHLSRISVRQCSPVIEVFAIS